MNPEHVSASRHEVAIPFGETRLTGDLVVPERPRGIVLFAHGSGSSRKSPRNVFVAEQLQRNGIATLLFDLLTRDEEFIDLRTRQYRFDIPLLARRLVESTRWVWTQPRVGELTVGYFGASTGSAAALIAAAELGERVRAVVSRGGRPDLAGDSTLASVAASTLLIVGSLDEVVLKLNRHAYAKLTCGKDLAVVRGATHLFEEPGTLEEVARLAAAWFDRHLGKGA